jgi:hypothetical protein
MQKLKGTGSTIGAAGSAEFLASKSAQGEALMRASLSNSAAVSKHRMRLVGFSAEGPSGIKSLPDCPDGYFRVSVLDCESASRVFAFDVPVDVLSAGEAGDSPERNKAAVENSIAVAADARCLVCTEDYVDAHLIPCRHLLHVSCLWKWMQVPEGRRQEAAPGESSTDLNMNCPVCSVAINKVTLAVPCVRQTDVKSISVSAGLAAQTKPTFTNSSMCDI